MFMIIPAIIAIAGMIFFVFSWRSNMAGDKRIAANNLQPPAAPETIKINYNRELFDSAIAEVRYRTSSGSGKEDIRGGIVPHHDLASPMLADFFYQLSRRREIKRFIILAPNHKNEGPWAVGSPADWQTDAGIIEGDAELYHSLKNSGAIQADNIILAEYSYQAPLPFIGYYFPDAKVLPIILTAKYNLEDADKLGRALSRYLDDRQTAIIAAVDFSHYLPIAQAQDNDQVALSGIKDNDYARIYGLDSGYLDSPAGIIVLLKAMEHCGADQLEILDHKNSADYARDDIYSTTGYFSLWFYKK